MPMDRTKYPPDWDDIATDVKARAGWRCEKCGRQCRLPGKPFDTHVRTLTVAHIDHHEMNCAESNLIALCPKCHLAYDAPMKAMRRLRAKRTKEYRSQGLLAK